MVQTLEPKVEVQQAVFAGDRQTFRDNFNRRSFAVTHSLASHPLFQIPRLLELAKSLASNPTDVLLSAGDAKVGQRQDSVSKFGFIDSTSAEDILQQIETANAWVLIKRAEVDPEYQAIQQACMAEIEDSIGVDLKPLIYRQHALIFITSPNRVTPYHIDRECNFLLQIHGSKEIHLFDKSDRSVLTEQEIERFWDADSHSATYKPEYEDRATVFDLAPGTGVHIPVNAPHWVKNSAEVSVSLSIVFHFHNHLLGDIYRMNHYLRKLGIGPSPPKSSQSPIPNGRDDMIKRYAYRPIQLVASARRRMKKA